MKPVRVGVVGVGALGQHHARVYASLPGVTLSGVHDSDSERSREVATRFGCRSYASLSSLAEDADCLSVAVPTKDHHAVTLELLRGGRDVLVEKPIATTLEEAGEMVATAEARGAVLQVGHIERFNPVVAALQENAKEPRFIEVHRLGAFTSRSLDIDVVLDLMIHDLDIVLVLDGSEAVQVDAVGVPVLTGKVDIANARLRFASGLIANLTASRVSVEKVRKFRVFAPKTYVSADFAEREAHVYRLAENPTGPGDIRVSRTSGKDVEPLQKQLEAFVEAVRTRGRPAVSGHDGLRALSLAQAILSRMEAHEALRTP